MENEKRGFVLTVVLVLVAAIVAGNFAVRQTRTESPITPTGYYTLGQGCSWQETPLNGYSGRSLCPASRPNVVAGGCDLGSDIRASFPQRSANFTTEGWECASNINTYGRVYANCCK